MPIAKELRRVGGPYGRHWRKVVRPRILKRAGGRFDASGKYLGGAACEQCRKPDREQVWVYSSPSSGQYWTASLILQAWRYCMLGGEAGSFMLNKQQESLAHKIWVRLQVCHLNHAYGDDRDENLKALCGWCHTNYDKLQHRDTRAARKDRKRPLLAIGGAA